MALHPQSSFAAGELDPALRERTTLDKYSSGLATARNVLVAKTGRIISRGARQLIAKTQIDGRKSIIYSPPYTGVVIEWGHLYYTVYSISPNNIFGTPDLAQLDYQVHDWTEADLPNIRFESTKGYVYAFCANKQPKKFYPGPGGGFISNIFAIPAAPTSVTGTYSATGYDTQYVATVVRGGQESLASGSSTAKFPVNAGEQVTLDINVGAVTSPPATEVRLYRRPLTAGAYGFVGSTSSQTTTGGFVHFSFKDIGFDADYTHSPPAQSPQITNRDIAITGPEGLLPPTGLIYQQRLLLTDSVNGEAILASRTGYQNNFYRDYPLSDDSALVFKAGSSGYARVLSMIESDGLVVFTTAGVFVHTGALVPDNLALEKRGNWVIDAALPPLSVPGGVLFLDSLTNTVRVLAYSNELGTYTGAELSIFSDHLFLGRKIVSWAFQDGETPVLWAVFNDGKFASFTYEPTQQMRAWTRADSANNVECATGTGVTGTTIFQTEYNGVRYLERTLQRYVPIATILSNPEAVMGPENAFMDMSLSVSYFLTQYWGTAHLYDGPNYVPWAGTLTLSPTVAGDWSQPLNLVVSGTTTQHLFQTGLTDPYSTNFGSVGQRFKWFDPTDHTSITLTVVSRTDDFNIVVQPSADFPPDYAVNPRLYFVSKYILLPSYYNGRDVSVMVDGYVVCSPNNDIEQYPILTPVGGVLTLPDEAAGAITHVGLPITADVQTLDMETVEQRPIQLESKTVNKVYIKVHRSRGLFAGPEFPQEESADPTDLDTLGDMEELESRDVNYAIDTDGVVIGNRYTEPKTERCEVVMKGDWSSNGRVCLRQVDPLHFEILSIIPDVSDLRRNG